MLDSFIHLSISEKTLDYSAIFKLFYSVTKQEFYLLINLNMIKTLSKEK